VLVRRRGAGTFVNDASPEVDLFSLGGTLASFRRSGVCLQTALTKKLALRKVGAEPENPYSLQRVYTLERLGSVDKKPVLLERFYFDPKVFTQMNKEVFDGTSLSRFVEQRYRLVPRGGRQTFTVTRPDGAVAAVLEVSVSTPLLLVRRRLDFPRAAGAVYTELYCDTGEFVFAQDIGDMTHA